MTLTSSSSTKAIIAGGKRQYGDLYIFLQSSDIISVANRALHGGVNAGKISAAPFSALIDMVISEQILNTLCHPGLYNKHPSSSFINIESWVQC